MLCSKKYLVNQIPRQEIAIGTIPLDIIDRNTIISIRIVIMWKKSKVGEFTSMIAIEI